MNGYGVCAVMLLGRTRLRSSLKPSPWTWQVTLPKGEHCQQANSLLNFGYHTIITKALTLNYHMAKTMYFKRNSESHIQLLMLYMTRY